MAGKSKIEWTDASWNPIRARNLKTGKVGWHCEHATTGCEFCYAESMNKRLGTGLPFKPGHRKDIEIFLDEDMLTAPLRWKKPRMIFVCSMTDAFADFVKVEWLDAMFAVMALCPQHTFQVLTKRAERMREYMAAATDDIANNFMDCRIGNLLVIAHMQMGSRYPGNARLELCSNAEHIASHPPEFQKKFHRTAGWPLPNVWLGISAERQQEWDERKKHLRDTPAAVHFASFEPLLGGIIEPNLADYIQWAIIGGESGPNARPFQLEWADSIVEQCKAADVRCFVKQLGAVPLSDGYPMHLKSSKGGDIQEWPDRLRVREFPTQRQEGER